MTLAAAILLIGLLYMTYRFHSVFCFILFCLVVVAVLP